MGTQRDDQDGRTTSPEGTFEHTARAAAAAVSEAGTAVLGAGAAALRKVLHKAPPGWAGSGHEDPSRWRVVTVCCTPDRLDPLPEPLARLGDAVEVTTRPAPGDRGTELAARLTGRPLPAPGGEPGGEPGREPGADQDMEPLQQLRAALRSSKQLVEVGWLLTPSPNASRPTATNAPLREAEDVAFGEGRL